MCLGFASSWHPPPYISLPPPIARYRHHHHHQSPDIAIVGSSSSSCPPHRGVRSCGNLCMSDSSESSPRWRQYPQVLSGGGAGEKKRKTMNDSAVAAAVSPPQAPQKTKTMPAPQAEPKQTAVAATAGGAAAPPTPATPPPAAAATRAAAPPIKLRGTVAAASALAAAAIRAAKKQSLEHHMHWAKARALRRNRDNRRPLSPQMPQLRRSPRATFIQCIRDDSRSPAPSRSDYSGSQSDYSRSPAPSRSLRSCGRREDQWIVGRKEASQADWSGPWQGPLARPSNIRLATPHHIGNLIFATWFIQPNANWEHVLNLIANTSVHTIVCIVPDHHSAVAESLMDCTRGVAEAKDVTGDRNVYLVHCNVFLVTLKRQVSTVSVQESVVFDGRAFAIVNCRGGPNNTAVAVGIVAALPHCTGAELGDTRLPEQLMSVVNNSVYKHGVRLLTGFGGNAKDQMSELCQILPLATGYPVSQAWRGHTSAVAELKGFPVYTLLLGKCHKFTTPAPKDLVHYRTALDQDWVPAVAGWHRLMPEWQPWTWRQIAWRPAGDMNWGQVKC